MDKKHQDAITKNLVALCGDLVLEPLLTILMEEKMFSQIDLQYIMAEKTDYEKNRKVCLDLKRKGPNAFQKFVNVLFDTDQDILAHKILLTEYNLRHGTGYVDYNEIPADGKFEAEGGCFSKRKKQSSTSSKGRPIVQATDEPTHNQRHPIQDPYSNAAASSSSKGGSGDHTDSDCYRMESDPRGHMLIINNKVFKDMDDRRGTEKDLEVLKTVFSRIGYEVEVKQNLKAEEMKTQLAAFAKKPAHKDVDSTVVAILSHGVEGAICGTDCEITNLTKTNLVYVKDVEELFNGDKCPLLRRKPKLFILQSCRGDKDDHGVWEHDGPTPDNLYAEKLRRERRRGWAPTYGDMIFAYPTISEYKAYRHTENGSPYIQSLCSIFNTRSLEKHVADMLTLVTKSIAGQDFSNDASPRSMMPQKTDTLTGFWYLNPKGLSR